MATRKYQFASAVALTRAEFARVEKVEIDLTAEDVADQFVRVVAAIESPSEEVVSIRTWTFTILQWESFLNAYDGLPGSTFEEKLLRVLPTLTEIPSGGDVRDINRPGGPGGPA